ncbi:DNA polymerase III subunit alpha [Klebsiella variicola subsp. variicola]|nr:DNA polymerase III subunit alpha [Klebsiella variicola subsp. variicola]
MGWQKTGPLVKKAASLGMPALAITDFTNLCGLVKFYGTGHGAGIKPIVGADFHVQCDLLGDEFTELTVLAANNTGYQNLTLLISRAYQRGYGALGPWIDRDWLVEHQEGLILLSGGRKGDVGVSLIRGNMPLVEQCVAFYEEHFPDRYFLELIRTGRQDEEAYLHAAVALAEARGLPVVATNDVRFLDTSDFDAHEIRVAIHDGFTLDDPKRPRNYSPQQYMRSEEEMCELFADIPEALENQRRDRQTLQRHRAAWRIFPAAVPDRRYDHGRFPGHEIERGSGRAAGISLPDPAVRAEKRPEYDQRLDIELQVINQMGFPGYFLIVMEFIQWSKDNGVPVGPGRGSGAGSLVAYALKITDLDPLEFDLLFERFLNPERVSMPDFDVDFCMEKRDQVIEHVADMYGRDAVSQIITFGTMAAKAVIRDVGRVLGHPYGFVDRISKLVPPDPGMTLAKAFEAEPQLPEIYEADEEVKALIDMARKLEGVTRNAGKHAGGVVIAPTKITDFAPLYCDEQGLHPVTQFDKNDVEYAGLVKFDFLGLRTLTIINWALEMISKRRAKNGEGPLDIAAIPLDDKKSFDMLQRSETTAVFQLESRGMKDLIKRLQPDCFEDMIALVALFRPGPLQSGMVDNFIDRKHGREEISYPDVQWQHESLKPVLEPTYGIILYQEQVMQIAQVLSGYTLGGADMLRRAMGKKKPEEMAKQRSIFEDGAKKNGVDGELAMKIFDLVEKFAGYGFNKSHSAAYALVSYQTLWLKAHYPAEFMAAVMTADMDNTEKVVGLVDECWRMGLKILPPDINSGLYHFHVNDDGEIVYGIGAIKGVGEGPIEAIIEARNNGGYFRELFDLCARTDIKKAQPPGAGKTDYVRGVRSSRSASRGADELAGRCVESRRPARESGGYWPGRYVRRTGGRA